MQRPAADADPLCVELIDRSSKVVDLAAPQVEGWTSGLLMAFDDDEGVLRFIDHCRSARGPVAALLCRGIAELTTGAAQAAAHDAAALLAEHMPPQGSAIGTSRAIAAWRVSAGFATSVIVGFGLEGSSPVDCDHSLLVEMDADGLLVDLRLSGSPHDLLPDPDSVVAGGPALEVDELALAVAGEEILQGWSAAAAERRVFEDTVAANERFARRRLEQLTGKSFPVIDPAPAESDPRRGMSAAEFDEANRAARSTLRAAIGDVAPHSPTTASTLAHDGWVAVVRGEVDGLGRREREALLYLEWADWLGAGIGLWRCGAGCVVDGFVLVDLVNRCPEVSSTITAADHAYIAAAFEVAIEHLDDCGAVADGRLTEAGHAGLPSALLAAWSPAEDQ